MAFAVLAAWLALLGALSAKPVRSDSGFALACLVFLLSAGFASLVRDVGRGEHFGLFLALACIAMPITLPWLAARALLLCAAVLVHDANLVMVAPLVAVDVLLARQSAVSLRATAGASACLLPALALTLYVGAAHTGCDVPAQAAHYARMAADFDFVAGPLDALCKNLAQNWQLTVHHLWQDEQQFRRVPPMLLAIAPGTIVTGWLLARVVGKNRWLLLAGIGASLAPLALLAIAVDVERLGTFVQPGIFLVLLAAVRRMGLPARGTLANDHRLAITLAAVAVFEFGYALPLNDLAEMAKPPFVPLLEHLDDAARGRVPFVIIPPD